MDIKALATQWIRYNMNDGCEQFEVCTLTNYTLRDFEEDVHEMLEVILKQQQGDDDDK